MTLPYKAGTVTLTNGSAAVTGNGTGWAAALIKGGVLFVEAAGNPGIPILDDDGAAANLHPITDVGLTLANIWMGPTGSYAYSIIRDTAYLQQVTANAQNLSEYLRQLGRPSLAALASLNGLAECLPYFTGPGTMALTPIPTFGRNLLNSGNRQTALATLGAIAAGQPAARAGRADGQVVMSQDADYGVLPASADFVSMRGGFYAGGIINGFPVMHVPLTGYYLISLKAWFANDSASRRIAAYINQTLPIVFAQAGNGDQLASATVVAPLNANDYFTLRPLLGSVKLIHAYNHTELSVAYLG